MRNLLICLYLTFLLVVTTANIVFGQAKTGHFKYGLISYEIIDSQDVETPVSNEMLSFIDQLHAEVYFNKSWVVVLYKKRDAISKSMYNRKSKVLYRFYDDPERK